jgi:MYXO-CTERM domain-containing protein
MDGGGKLWGPFSAGIAVSTVYSPQWIDATFIEDDSAFVTFQDSQNVVWIKHVNADGTLGTVDAGIDAGVDAGVDAGPDAGEDAGPDAGEDAGVGTDGGIDGGTDAGGDGGNQINWPDAGDAGTDGGLPDSGQMADAGTSGGGCSTGTGPDPMWLVAGLAIVVFAGRRRLRQI